MASIKKRSSAAPAELNAGVSAPGPLEISVEDLQNLLQSAAAKSVLVVDVRSADEFAISHIPGSINKPFQEIHFDALVAEAASCAANGPPMLVFVSAQSPDLDDLAAREYISAFEKAHACSPPEGSIRVLLGGLYTWSERKVHQ